MLIGHEVLGQPVQQPFPAAGLLVRQPGADVGPVEHALIRVGEEGPELLPGVAPGQREAGGEVLRHALHDVVGGVQRAERVGGSHGW